MSRKSRALERKILPDSRYQDLVLARAINIIMERGKKSVAEGAIYGALEILKKKGDDPVEVFHKAISNIRPIVEVRSRRVGGATYQVPTEVRARRAESLALRWLKVAAESRGERTLAERLAGELMEALQNKGFAIKKKEDTHRMAEANKAFAHFKW